jgi:hypothetical protein
LPETLISKKTGEKQIFSHRIRGDFSRS